MTARERMRRSYAERKATGRCVQSGCDEKPTRGVRCNGCNAYCTLAHRNQRAAKRTGGQREGESPGGE
jgi:hypothetical protein